MPRRPCGASTIAVSTFRSRKGGGTHVSFYALEIQTQKERAGMTVLLASPSGDLGLVPRRHWKDDGG